VYCGDQAEYINALCSGSAKFVLVQRVAHIITKDVITLNTNLNTMSSGEGLESTRLADRKVIMDIWAGIFGKASTQSWVIRVRRANVVLKYVKCCKEISSGRLLFLIMVFTSRIIDFMKGKM